MPALPGIAARFVTLVTKRAVVTKRAATALNRNQTATLVNPYRMVSQFRWLIMPW